MPVQQPVENVDKMLSIFRLRAVNLVVNLVPVIKDGILAGCKRGGRICRRYYFIIMPRPLGDDAV